VNWGWYQQGFNSNDAPDPLEGEAAGNPTGGAIDNTSTADTPTAGYVTHHNGPQYFAYIADNPTELKNNLHGNKDFFNAVNNQMLPTTGGVFYLRGGANNNDGLVPPSGMSPTEQVVYAGNDDHPGNSDSQIAEAMAAKAINAIVNSPYWANSAIVITWDETDGIYDHAQANVSSTLTDHLPYTGGPRVPTLLISPFAAAGTIPHSYNEHGSIVKFIDEVFDLVPLADLPNEVHGREVGAASSATLNQKNLEPFDDPTNDLGDLSDAFDYGILQGQKPPLSGSLATFTPSQIATLPQLATNPAGITNGACHALNGGAGILPTDFPSWEAYNAGTPIDPAPVDYNPRPGSALVGGAPGTPTQVGWVP
jgi:phospholipase C